MLSCATAPDYLPPTSLLPGRIHNADRKRANSREIPKPADEWRTDLNGCTKGVEAAPETGVSAAARQVV